MRKKLSALCLFALVMLCSSRAHAAVVTVVWDPMPGIAGYTVHYGTAAGQYTVTVDVGLNTGYRFTNLVAGTQYFFAVKSYDANGNRSPLSAEVSTYIESAPQTAPTLDLTALAAPTSLDAAFDPATRRYVVAYSAGGQAWISMLDVWGAPIGAPQSLTPGGSGVDARVTAGGGRFLVLYTDTTTGQRVGRFVVAGPLTPSLGVPYSLGPASVVSGATDSPGGGAIYSPGDDLFLAAWQNAGNVFVRGLSSAGPTGAALNLSGDTPITGCLYARPEIAWDPSLRRALVLGSREGTGCTPGSAVWTRLVGFDGVVARVVSDLSEISVDPVSQTDRRVAFSNLHNRFILVWSERQGTQTNLVYRLADATGGLSAIHTVPSGGTSTPELEDDAYTENGVALDTSGAFAVVSRANPAAGTQAGQLYFQRIDEDGNFIGSLHALPASGIRTRTALTSNVVTGQLLAAYLDVNGHVRAMTIGPRVPTTVAVTASSTQVPAGSPVTITAAGAGGAAPYEFAFWRYDQTRGGWTEEQSYAATNQLSWTPSSAQIGRHSIQVWARSSGSTSNPENWKNVDIDVTQAVPLSVTLTSDRTSPVPVNATVTWTAVRAGGTGSIEYQFWLYDTIGATWIVARPYGPSNVFAWTPATSGVFVVQVWARAVGSAASNEAWAGSGNMTVVAAPPVIITSLTASRVSTTPGTPVVWTAQASGGVGPLQYQFWRYKADPGTWTIVRPYGTSATYSWTPGAADAGSYMIQVWAKGVGSTADYDAWLASSTLTVTNVTLTNLQPSVTMPGKVNVPITWTATASRVAGTIEYEFWTYSVTTATWQLLRGYGSASCVWTPATPGQYSVQVWARAVGSNISYEVWRGYGPFVINP